MGEFNQSDLEASLTFLEKHMFNNDISWPTVGYQICEVQYGGRITDDFDRHLFNTYGDTWFGEHLFGEDFTFAKIKDVFDYGVVRIPEETSEKYRAEISAMPSHDSPEIFGLHPNADLSYGTSSSIHMLNTVLDTLPKEAGGGGGKTRDQIVYEKCGELLAQMPTDYRDDDVRRAIKKRPQAEVIALLGRAGVGTDGMSMPLNVCLYQEITRLQGVINSVRSTLTNLQLAIDGVVIMTPELQTALNAIFDAKPPHFWHHDPSGAQIAWVLPTLALWFAGLLDREKQLSTWLRSGRPNCFWLTGFFNPQGFLTAMRQEVTRKHKAEKWALDDVVFHTEVTNMDDVRRIKGPPDEGVYILSLHRWSRLGSQGTEAC